MFSKLIYSEECVEKWPTQSTEAQQTHVSSSAFNIHMAAVFCRVSSVARSSTVGVTVLLMLPSMLLIPPSVLSRASSLTCFPTKRREKAHPAPTKNFYSQPGQLPCACHPMPKPAYLTLFHTFC